MQTRRRQARRDRPRPHRDDTSRGGPQNPAIPPGFAALNQPAPSNLNPQAQAYRPNPPNWQQQQFYRNDPQNWPQHNQCQSGRNSSRRRPNSGEQRQINSLRREDQPHNARQGSMPPREEKKAPDKRKPGAADGFDRVHQESGNEEKKGAEYPSCVLCFEEMKVGR